jgi:hypothetical protein
MSIAACISGAPVDPARISMPARLGCSPRQPISESGVEIHRRAETSGRAASHVPAPVALVAWSGGERPMVVDGYPWSPVPALTSRFGFLAQLALALHWRRGLIGMLATRVLGPCESRKLESRKREAGWT